MSFIEVVRYQLNWNFTKSVGTINLVNAQGEIANIETENPLLFPIWVDMLRNEKPVYFDLSTSDLRTGGEPVGENED